MGRVADEDWVLIQRILRIRRGEEDRSAEVDAAGEVLFSRSRGKLLGYCRRLLKDEEKGKDIAQQALEKAWDKLAQFRGDSSFESWVFAIASKMCFRELRVKAPLLLDPEVVAVPPSDQTPLQLLTREERKRMVRFAAAGLSELEQQVVYLRYYEGLPYEAIEEVLQIDLTERASGARGLLVNCKRHLTSRIVLWLEENRLGLSFLRTQV
jgi:RNA polymerase sigma-70 factor, ECF subfamily